MTGAQEGQQGPEADVRLEDDLYQFVQAVQGRQPTGEQPGRVIRTVPDPDAQRLNLPATLRSALSRGSETADEFQLSREDFHAPVQEIQSGRRVLFVADAIGSVGVAGRMGALKGAILEVLAGGSGRDRAALMTFRGTGAELLLDWTTDRQVAEEAVQGAVTGGRTPNWCRSPTDAPTSP